MQNAQSDKHKFIMKSRGFKANRSQYIETIVKLVWTRNRWSNYMY